LVLLGLAKPNHQQNLRPGVTKAALSFAWFGEAKPLQNQVSLYRLNIAAPAARSGYTRSVFKPIWGAELLLSYAEQARWFCLGAASFEL